MAWPWRRFDEMFKRHLLRRAKDRLERQADELSAAINANSNYDGEDNAPAKQARLQQIEDSCRDAIATLYKDPVEEQRREAEDPYSYENDPLFRSARRMREQARAPVPAEAGMGHDMIRHMAATG